MRCNMKQWTKDSLVAVAALGTGLYIALPRNISQVDQVSDLNIPLIETPYMPQEISLPQQVPSCSLEDMITKNLSQLPTVPEDSQYTDPNKAGHPLYRITDPELQVAPHFKLREFVTSGGQVQEYARISPGIVSAMEQLRNTIGQPIIITSGYRCPERNTAVGGSSKSRHMSGDAVDIDVKGMSPQVLSEKVIEVLGEDIGLHTYADGHVHVDLRGYKARW